MADAGFRLTVEGEKEFREALKAIDAQIKTSTSELKLLAEQYKISEAPMESLEARQKSLADAMELQAQKSQSIAEQIEKVSAAYGENDSRVLTLTQSYNASQTQLAKLTGEYKTATETMENARAAMENMSEMQRVIDDTTEEFAAAVKVSYEQIEAFDSSLGKSDDAMQNSKAKIEQLDKTYDGLAENIEKQKRNIANLTENLQKAEKAYGESSSETKEFREQLDKATKALDDMEQAAEDNRKAVEKIGEDNGGLDGMLDVVEKISDIIGIDIPDGIKDMIGGESRGGFIGAAGAAAGIGTALVGVAGKISETFQETLDWADELTRKSQVLGVDSETYQALEYAAGKIGVEMDDIDDAFNEIAIKANEAIDIANNYYDEVAKLEAEAATKKQELLNEYNANMPQYDPQKGYDAYMRELEDYEHAYETSLQKINDDYRESSEQLRTTAEETVGIFNNLGIEIADASGQVKPTEDIFLELVDAMNQIENPSERLAKAVELLGEGARKLNPIFDVGSDGLRNYMQRAHDLGIVMDNETAQALDNIDSEMYDLNKTMEAASRDFIPNTINGFKDIATVLSGGSVNPNSSKGLLGYIKGIGQELGVLFGIPGYADGTSFASGGWSLVGERGPEIVHLPRGSQVFPNGIIPEMGGAVSENNVYNITISAKDVQEFNDIVRIAQNQKQSIRMGYSGRR